MNPELDPEAAKQLEEYGVFRTNTCTTSTYRKYLSLSTGMIAMK